MFVAIQTKDLEFHVGDDLEMMEPVDWLGSDPTLFIYRPGTPTSRREVFTHDVPMRGRYARVRMRKDTPPLAAPNPPLTISSWLPTIRFLLVATSFGVWCVLVLFPGNRRRAAPGLKPNVSRCLSMIPFPMCPFLLGMLLRLVVPFRTVRTFCIVSGALFFVCVVVLSEYNAADC